MRVQVDMNVIAPPHPTNPHPDCTTYIPCVCHLTWTLLPHPTPPLPTLTAQHTFHACATWHERYCPTPPFPPHITDMHSVLRVSRDVHDFSSASWTNRLAVGFLNIRQRPVRGFPVPVELLLGVCLEFLLRLLWGFWKSWGGCPHGFSGFVSQACFSASAASGSGRHEVRLMLKQPWVAHELKIRVVLMSLFGFVAFVIWCYVILSFSSWVREDLGHKGRHTEARPLHEPVEIVVPGNRAGFSACLVLCLLQQRLACVGSVDFGQIGMLACAKNILRNKGLARLLPKPTAENGRKTLRLVLFSRLLRNFRSDRMKSMYGKKRGYKKYGRTLVEVPVDWSCWPVQK